jgi:DUF1680 family protein
MRTLSSWEQLLVTTDPSGVQVHQYADAEIRADVAGGEVRLRMATGYPWAGQVTIDIVAAPSEPWTLTLRRPAWARDGQVTWPDGAGVREADTRTATWRPGDRVVVDLDMEPRVVAPDPRIDAVRDCVALERGPLVYCIETADLPAGTALEELSLEPVIEPVAQPRPDLLDGAVGLAVRATRRTRDDHAWPYDETPPDEETPPDPPSSSSERTEEVRAIPYLAWANRGPGAMRVWIPRDGGAA